MPRSPEPMQRAGIYLHIPFCRSKCAYCDFNSYAGLEALHSANAKALLSQIRETGSQGDLTYDTLYVGGGTPTVYAPEQLVALLSACRCHLGLPSDAEATVEANPGTVEQDTLLALTEGGYNRLSLGVQSLHDDELALLGRMHDRRAALDAVQAARQAGFASLNLDLIYGLPQQTVPRWRATLEQALALEPEHLSLYALTIEEHTPLAERIARGALPPPDDDRAADMYELAVELLAQAGYLRYEISNWARRSAADIPGGPPALACRHNLHYWRNEPYLGLGAGAHGYDGRRRYAHLADPVAYVRAALGRGSTVAWSEDIDRERAMDETLMLGLRLTQGVTWEEFEHRFGARLEEVYAEALASLADTGLLEIDALGIRLAPRGYLLGNRVFSAFMRAAP